jgi:hypothetical protein
MDDDWIIVFDVEHADLEKCSVGCWADKHDQVIIQDHSSHGVAKGVPYVRVGDPVLSRWLADPHLDNIACLSSSKRPAPYAISLSDRFAFTVAPTAPSCMPPYHGTRAALARSRGLRNVRPSPLTP